MITRRVEERDRSAIPHCRGAPMELPGVEEVFRSVRPGGGVEEDDRRSEVRSRRMALERIRGERIRAQWRRRLRR